MAAGTPVLPGGSNTYIANAKATGNMRVSFSRNPKDFALNRYIQIRDVTQDRGYYLRINCEQAMRIVNSDLSDFVWPDGHPRPQANNNNEKFYFVDYRTERRSVPWQLGDKSRNQAEWDIDASELEIHAQQAMTVRTADVHRLLSNTANWDAAHVLDVTAISGNTGAWDVSTVARHDIKRSINAGVEQILLATGSVVRRRDLNLVINPTTAHAISETQEIADYVKNTPGGYAALAQESEYWDEYGLPNKLYGVPLVVEDAVKVTSARGASSVTRSFVMGDGIAYLMARKGALEAKAGGPSFTTAMLFVYEDMTVEELHDTNNRRLDGSVVDDIAPALTAPSSGIYFTNLLT